MAEGKCKWCKDEVCVNDKCPKVADFCPVVDTPQLCHYAEMELEFDFKINALKMDGETVVGLISTQGYTIEFQDKDGKPIPLNKNAVDRLLKRRRSRKDDK
jgi:hypothetical protein